MTTLRDFLLARSRAVPVDEADPAGVHVRPLTLAEVHDLRDRVKDLPEADKDAAANVWIVTRSACGPDGARIFGDDDFPAVALLGSFDSGPILTAAHRLNRFDETAKAAAKKNSGPTPS